MTNSVALSSPRDRVKAISTRRRSRALASLAALIGALALTFGAALPATAAINSATPNPINNGATLTVNFTIPTGTATTITQYSIAICDTTASIGTKCDATAVSHYIVQTAGTAGSTYTKAVVTAKSFAPTNFTVNPPTTGSPNVNCRGTSGVQCAVYVSYYNSSGGFVTFDVRNITFN